VPARRKERKLKKESGLPGPCPSRKGGARNLLAGSVEGKTSTRKGDVIPPLPGVMNPSKIGSSPNLGGRIGPPEKKGNQRFI